MKNKEILDLTPDELRARKRELREEVFHLRLQQQSGQLEKPSQLRALRREIARLETVLTQKTKATTTPAQPEAPASKKPKAAAAKATKKTK
jgi:large subunit ribosomal protein L29